MKVWMHQSEANRFCFGPGKAFPCQAYAHCCMEHPAFIVPLSVVSFFGQKMVVILFTFTIFTI